MKDYLSKMMFIVITVQLFAVIVINLDVVVLLILLFLSIVTFRFDNDIKERAKKEGGFRLIIY